MARGKGQPFDAPTSVRIQWSLGGKAAQLHRCNVTAGNSSNCEEELSERF